MGGTGQNKHFDKKGETFPWQSRVCANVVQKGKQQSTFFCVIVCNFWGGLEKEKKNYNLTRESDVYLTLKSMCKCGLGRETTVRFLLFYRIYNIYILYIYIIYIIYIYLYIYIYITEHKQNAHNDRNRAQHLKRLFETLFFAIKKCTGFTTDVIQWNTKCAVSLANQLRAVVDAFRP